MKLVVDASVAVKWLLEEDGSAQARGVLSSRASLLAPELILAETSNVAWKKLRRGEITREHARAIVHLLPRLLDDIAGLAPLSAAALTIARDLDHPVYDTYYLALADREGVDLVSDDQRLLSRLEGTPWSQRLRPLSSFSASTA